MALIEFGLMRRKVCLNIPTRHGLLFPAKSSSACFYVDQSLSCLCKTVPVNLKLVYKRMATFSPSPAPRRSTRPRTRGSSPSRRSQIIRQALTPLHFPNDTASNASAMDIDERGSTITEHSSRVASDFIFSKTPEMSVSFYANLPLEVNQILRTSGASLAYDRPQLLTYHSYRS